MDNTKPLTGDDTGYTATITTIYDSIADASKEIKFGHPSVTLAGGIECLSDVPIAYSKEARQFLFPSKFQSGC